MFSLIDYLNEQTKKKKQKQKLGKQRISRTAENQLMGVQVQNPDLIVRRGGACLFVCFFNQKRA